MFDIEGLSQLPIIVALAVIFAMVLWWVLKDNSTSHREKTMAFMGMLKEKDQEFTKAIADKDDKFISYLRENRDGEIKLREEVIVTLKEISNHSEANIKATEKLVENVDKLRQAAYQRN